MKLPHFLTINHFWRIIPFKRHGYTSSVSAVRYNSAQENVALSLADTNKRNYIARIIRLNSAWDLNWAELVLDWTWIGVAIHLHRERNEIKTLFIDIFLTSLRIKRVFGIFPVTFLSPWNLQRKKVVACGHKKIYLDLPWNSVNRDWWGSADSNNWQYRWG